MSVELLDIEHMRIFKKVAALIVCAIVLHYSVYAQYLHNYIPNGSFENITSCDSGYDMHNIGNAPPWFYYLDGKSELFNKCFSKLLPDTFSNGVPINIFGTHNARTGVGYAGEGVASNNQYGFTSREYLAVPLVRALTQSRTYYAKYYVAAAYRKYCHLGYSYCNRSGIALTDTYSTKPSYYGQLLNYKAQVENDSTRMLNDTVGWIPVSGVFTANGKEKYATIGNFHDDAHTKVFSLFAIPNSADTGVIQYIDDVSLVELPDTLTPPLTGWDTTVCPEEYLHIKLGDTAEHYTEHEYYTYKWYPATGLSNANISNPIASPTVTTTYTCVKSLDNVMQSQATVTITIDGCITYLPEPGVWFMNAFTPNNDGRDDKFGAICNAPNAVTNYNLQVYNRWGQRIFATTNVSERWDGTFNGRPLEQGTYMYIATYTLEGKDYKKSGDVELLR